MKPLLSLVFTLTIGLLTSHSSYAQALRVSVTGEAKLDPAIAFSSDDRIGNVVAATTNSTDAYLTGAAWIRQSAVLHQSARRLLLLSDLPKLKLAEALELSLQQQVQQLKATGRVVFPFDWQLLELKPEQNRHLAPADQFYVPARPTIIQVVGAVKPYSVPFEPGKTVAEYSAELKRLDGADLSYVWVIAPDTSMRKVGIAYWNTELAYLAPGSYLYVPVADGGESLQAFQHSLRQLFSAQLLP
ncbi:capsule biosynthesis GfcC family protein [Shewanella avicenniae]|uniref:Capsule biosynthesis GfcC family protein n=1 Tax=Shewanella avicenniae TaxID=2814294 RepID=A0ABX7QRK6_9GAMM|nr:capsule biosynthesis GfcC family protein [Shewanella avicenniae]QSX33625.1 capsule biosynthesis GfcC family protein [Shewanella avicenniae]